MRACILNFICVSMNMLLQEFHTHCREQRTEEDLRKKEDMVSLHFGRFSLVCTRLGSPPNALADGDIDCGEVLSSCELEPATSKAVSCSENMAP